MESSINNSISSPVNVNNESATAIAAPKLSYGVASGVTGPSAQAAPSGYLTFAEQLKYFSCEYLHGLLFVAVSLLFAIAVPVVLTKPAEVKAMVGRVFKRVLDIVGALAGLILSLPLFILVPLLIKLDSQGPVFYCQVRVGENRRRNSRRYHQKSDVEDRRRRDRRRDDIMGRPFKVIKFRTMVQDAEKKCGPVWATKDDPRITTLGRILRRSRLDEIPQFINVLKGDMALVGPRPERPNFVRDLSAKVDGYSRRLDVKPGLTGLAQVETGYDSDVDSVARKVRLDLQYIGDWSLWADVKILMKTVVVVLTGRGAC